MDVEYVLDFLFNPATGRAIIIGLFAGLTIGWAFAFFFYRKNIEDLKDELKRLNGKLNDKQTDLYESEAQTLECQARIKILEKRVTSTIKCAICGGEMKRLREYEKRKVDGTFVFVDLKCVSEECGQVIPFYRAEIKDLTKGFNLAKPGST